VLFLVFICRLLGRAVRGSDRRLKNSVQVGIELQHCVEMKRTHVGETKGIVVSRYRLRSPILLAYAALRIRLAASLLIYCVCVH